MQIHRRSKGGKPSLTSGIREDGCALPDSRVPSMWSPDYRPLVVDRRGIGRCPDWEEEDIGVTLQSSHGRFLLSTQAAAVPECDDNESSEIHEGSFPIPAEK